MPCMRVCICAVQTWSNMPVLCIIGVNKVRKGHLGVSMMTLAPCFFLFQTLWGEPDLYFSPWGTLQSLSISLSLLPLLTLSWFLLWKMYACKLLQTGELVSESKSNLLVPYPLLHQGKRFLPRSTQLRSSRGVNMACLERRCKVNSWRDSDDLGYCYRKNVMVWLKVGFDKL